MASRSLCLSETENPFTSSVLGDQCDMKLPLYIHLPRTLVHGRIASILLLTDLELFRSVRYMSSLII